MHQGVLARLALMVLIGVALLPAGARAQSGIAGAVRDTSGAVLPGVTVEASSPALIEKVRTVVTDAEGLYRLIDLRPGTYAVTFTLPGFNTARREGIVLETNFMANVAVELRVGAIEETVTVSGETPVVDIQTTQKQQVLTKELLEALPSARNWGTNIVSSVTRAPDVGGSGSTSHANLNVYGSTDGQDVQVDGISVATAGKAPGVYYNFDSLEEIAYQVGGGTAEATVGGVVVNMIPRQGGNQFRGDATIIYADHNFQTSNVTGDLSRRGLTAAPGLYKQHDLNASLGGPIKRDKLWFFTSGRSWAVNNYVGNGFGSTSGQQAKSDDSLWAWTNRVTYQVTPKNKLSGMYDILRKNQGHRSIAAGFAPEAAYVSTTPNPTANAIVKWTVTLSSKLLVDVGFASQQFRLIGTYEPEVQGPSATNPYGDIAKVDLLQNVRWSNYTQGETVLNWGEERITSSVSYVTGTHSIKVGEQYGFRGWAQNGARRQYGNMVQQYRNGAPESILAYNSPNVNQTNIDFEIALYAQDSWTIERLTLNPGIRWERIRNSFPEQRQPAGRFVPERVFPAVRGIIDWTDVSPRMGAAYDLFGDGKTALKASVGKYVQFDQTSTAAQYNPMVVSTDPRTWTDLNRDDIAQDNELGPSTNNTFGIRRNRNPDPDLKRPYSWLTNIGIQQQLASGVGLSVSYNRRNYRRLIYTTNLDAPHSAYTLLTIPDPRGNGERLPIYNLNVANRGLINELDTNSDRDTRLYDGVDVAVNSRFGNGGVLIASTSTGRVRTISCDVADPNQLRFCDQTKLPIPFLTSVRLAGAYPLPYGVRLSGVFQSAPGAQTSGGVYQDLATNYVVNRSIVPNLTNTSVTIRLDTPGSQFLPRINQLDFILGRDFKTGRLTIQPRLEFYNALNTSPVLGQVTTFGTSLGTPQNILQARMFRVSTQLKF